MNRVRLMDTGRYCEAATYRGETIEDVDAMFSLKIDNVFDATYASKISLTFSQLLSYLLSSFCFPNVLFVARRLFARNSKCKFPHSIGRPSDFSSSFTTACYRIVLFPCQLTAKHSYGRLGDVYRPVNKNAMTYQPFFFVRFMHFEDMQLAKSELQGKIVCGRPMKITDAKPKFELETSVY